MQDRWGRGVATVTRNDKNSLIENTVRMCNILFAVAAYAWWAHRSIHVRIWNGFSKSGLAFSIVTMSDIQISQTSLKRRRHYAILMEMLLFVCGRWRFVGNRMRWHRPTECDRRKSVAMPAHSIHPSMHHICCGFLFPIFYATTMQCSLLTYVCVRYCLNKMEWNRIEDNRKQHTHTTQTWWEQPAAPKSWYIKLKMEKSKRPKTMQRLLKEHTASDLSLRRREKILRKKNLKWSGMIEI